MGRENSEKRLDCCAERVRQHKKTLSRVSGKRKKKDHPYGCVHRYKDTFKGLVREGPEE